MTPTPLSETTSHTACNTLLAELRLWMKANNLDFCIIPSSDEFLSEYVPAHLNRRLAISGFTGSAGDVLIGQTEAWLFVDGRYHAQAETEVDTALFNIEKLGQKDVLALDKKLAELSKTLSETQNFVTIGLPANCITQAQLDKWQKTVEKKAGKESIQWQLLETHPLDTFWNSRPVFSPALWHGVSPQAAGKTTGEKLRSLRITMTDANVSHLPLMSLDEVAWVFNIRSNDIPHTPVGLAYGWLTITEAHLCAENIPTELAKSLAKEGVTLHPHGPNAFWPAWQASLSKGNTVWIDEKHTPAQLVSTLPADISKHNAPSPVQAAKAIKNQAELNGMRHSHLAASVALCTAWYQLETALESGQATTEGQFVQWIYEAYASHPAFQQLSFPSIVGAGPNGAIVHYHTGESTQLIQAGELLLFDSGAQYYCHDWMGTTDTTRTILIGNGDATQEQKFRYTQVLKAHIALSKQVFPSKTTGVQLDAITRASLWQCGMDFLHGTGHGVGCYLGVHEGPCGISKGYTSEFKPSMITSNEPGFYQAGWGGIRLENLMVCIETKQKLSTTNEVMLGFEPLIWVPFDLNLIDSTLFTAHEIQALNQYHQGVLENILHLINPVLQDWLKIKCQMI